jgi:agmatine deiminase
MRFAALLLSLLLAPPTLAHESEWAASQALPAWPLPGEEEAGGKADEADDYRQQHPEWFGVTAPPAVPVRPFAEYEPTQAVLLRPSSSISKFHKEILKGLHGHVDHIVTLHVDGQLDALTEQLGKLGILDGSIEPVDVGEINANWTRDYGPLSVVSGDGRIGLVDFRYYHGRAYDDAVPAKIGEHWGVHVFRPSMSYEGGNFMADPHGTCYATQKLMNQNAGFPVAQVEEWMEEYLGCTQLVLLKLPNELGTGHIDMFSKLMDDSTILLGYYDPEVRPANHVILEDNKAILDAVVTQGGDSLSVHRLPLPWNDSHVWFTYTNSLIVNDVVLIPVFDGFEDEEAEAMAAYEAAAPHLERVLINSDSIIPAGGAIHCVTMTVPKGQLVPFQPAVTPLCPTNDLKDCGGVSGLCATTPYEGQCVGDTLAYCGVDGYPHQLPCASCCGFDPSGLQGTGWHDCLSSCLPCTDECASGDNGCSYLATHQWTCVSGPDGCLVRDYARCPGATVCSEATGLCNPPECGPEGCPGGCGDCQPGVRQCNDDGRVELCLLDGAGCGVLVVQPVCESGLVCLEGVCLEPLPEPFYDDVVGTDLTSAPPSKSSGGCAVGMGARPWPLALLLALLLSGLFMRRHGNA